jgi:HD superfamily phosphohydrolase
LELSVQNVNEINDLFSHHVNALYEKMSQERAAREAAYTELNQNLVQTGARLEARMERLEDQWKSMGAMTEKLTVMISKFDEFFNVYESLPNLFRAKLESDYLGSLIDLRQETLEEFTKLYKRFTVETAAQLQRMIDVLFSEFKYKSEIIYCFIREMNSIESTQGKEEVIQYDSYFYLITYASGSYLVVNGLVGVHKMLSYLLMIRIKSFS